MSAGTYNRPATTPDEDGIAGRGSIVHRGELLDRDDLDDGTRANDVSAAGDAEDVIDVETGDDVETVDAEAVEDDEPGKASASLFTAENAGDFRSRWDAVQRGFVDDPAKAVRDGDALVCELINELARTFADARTALEGKQTRPGAGATESLRLALRRRRALLEQLLAL